MEGTVKFFNERKNFGFISPDEGDEDLFVHKSDIEAGTTLSEGDKVEFEAEQGDKGPRAVKVSKL
ncbi:cold-shock protein [candidate division MSBL1 archaeon SCGC-AAA833F18]|uniref:Cold-shock protein n=2 Tax=candidate division MSBL1 TaxID=215777 RepID=A0A133VT01_9EURY|nr:cold-shock protein [candidate division MSBL1 archaeon SCGC-AAA833F18]KXB09584.1 cold-shock protein [candidate division MSBL1 archaeon SCGC-AAA833K04]